MKKIEEKKSKIVVELWHNKDHEIGVDVKTLGIRLLDDNDKLGHDIILSIPLYKLLDIRRVIDFRNLSDAFRKIDEILLDFLIEEKNEKQKD